MAAETDEPEAIELYVTSGFRGYLTLRMSPAVVDEVLSLLDEHGIEHGSILGLSGDVALWVEAVRVLGTAGGLASLASVINTFIKRHDDKRILVERPDGEKVELQGFSKKTVEEILQKRAEEQAVRDAQLERIKGDPKLE